MIPLGVLAAPRHMLPVPINLTPTHFAEAVRDPSVSHAIEITASARHVIVCLAFRRVESDERLGEVSFNGVPMVLDAGRVNVRTALVYSLAIPEQPSTSAVLDVQWGTVSSTDPPLVGVYCADRALSVATSAYTGPHGYTPMLFEHEGEVAVASVQTDGGTWELDPPEDYRVINAYIQHATDGLPISVLQPQTTRGAAIAAVAYK